MFRCSISDENNRPIAPVYQAGTPAQHFAACVQMQLDFLSNGPTLQYFNNKHKQHGSNTRALISKVLPGGLRDNKLMQTFNNTFKPLPFNKGNIVMFITSMHDHPEITPDVFLKKWENEKISELGKLLSLPVEGSELEINLLIDIFKKIKIPGVGQCKIERIVSETKISDKSKDDKKDDNNQRVILSYSPSADTYVKNLSSVIGKEVKKVSNTHQVSLSKMWLRQLNEKALTEIKDGLQKSENLDDFKRLCGWKQ